MSYIPAIADPNATRIPTVKTHEMNNPKETWRHRAYLIPSEWDRGYDNHAGKGRRALSVPKFDKTPKVEFTMAMTNRVRTDSMCSYQESVDRNRLVSVKEEGGVIDMHGLPLEVPLEEIVGHDRIYHQQIGLEITRIHAVDPKSTEELESFSETEMNLANRAWRFFRSRYPLLGAHGDCDAVEFASPPCGSKSGLLYYWNHYREACAMYNLVHKEKLVTSHTYKLRGQEVSMGTGGLHIHIAFPNLFMLNAEELALFKHNINVDAANNPHIAWLFQEWYKNGTNPYLDFSMCNRAKNKTWTDAQLIELMNQNRRTPFAVRDENINFRNQTNTTEYRCFETPETFAEVYDLIRFVHAHQAKMFYYATAGVKLTTNFTRYHRLTRLSISEMRRQYIYDFERMELDPTKYLDKYFKNFVKRKENGTVTKYVRDITD